MSIVEDYPFSVLQADELHLLEGDRNPIEDAIAEMHACFDPGKILVLLESENPNVTETGLLVTSELGRKSFAVIDSILQHTMHPKWTARFYVADCLLACNKDLDVDQMSKSLVLAADESVNVRCKEMEVLSFFDQHEIGDFTSRIGPGDKAWQFYSEHTHANDSADEAVESNMRVMRESGSRTERCLAGSRLLRLARNGHLAELGTICACVDEEEGSFLQWKVKMIAKYKHNH